MKETKPTIKKPLSEKIIFKNMMTTVLAVSALFFMKNILGKSWQGAIVIGTCLLIFSILVIFMRKNNISQGKQQFAMCISIALLVFCISLNSGAYYSDDFPLYLAVIGISGLYLVPKYTLFQTVLIDILLIIAYFIHPEKADPFSQYMMCVVLLTVAAFTFYMVIKRGRSYIELGQMRAEEAESLLAELKDAGEKLQSNCDRSLDRIAKLEKANTHLEASVADLRTGSNSITLGTVEVTQTFDSVQDKMQTTQKHISSLNHEVKKVEEAFADSKHNMKEMTSEMESLRKTLQTTNEVFSTLQSEIYEISQFTSQLNKIATNTNTLALNASIEAARAGQMGAGFAIVASKVQNLSEDSNKCSSQIVSIMSAMQKRIEETSIQLSQSFNGINQSIDSLNGFQNSFSQLTAQFNSLYKNIEEQNENIQQMDHVFSDLKDKISEMAESSEANQESVAMITDSIDIYKNNINKIVDDNIIISHLSSSLLESANQQIEKDE